MRPVGEPEHPGIKVRQATQDGYGFRHDWLPMQFDDHMLKVQIDQDADGHRHVEESMRVWNTDLDRPGRAPRPPRGRRSTTSRARARCAARRSPCADGPTGKPIVVTNTPLRTLYLAAGSGYVNLDGEWGHGVLPGRAEGRRASCTTSADPEERRKYAVLNETLCRFELDTGEVGYGMHENMLIGIYHPTGFHTPGRRRPSDPRASCPTAPIPCRGG